ncbi:MAG: hypothetical protein R3A79_22900 [Nannocystaceae bacterium]
MRSVALVAVALVALSGCRPCPCPCSEPAARTDDPAPPRSDAERLAAHPPVRFLGRLSSVHRRAGAASSGAAAASWEGGVLVRANAGAPPLASGERLALLYLDGGGVVDLEVSERRCPPGIDDCLECRTRWATAVGGAALDADRPALIVGPLGGDVRALAARITERRQPEVSLSGRVVLSVRCDGASGARCDETLTLAGETRVLAAAPPPSPPQIFARKTWPGEQLDGAPLGGDGVVVLQQWGPRPAVPEAAAEYVLLGPSGVRGRARAGAPEGKASCDGGVYPCWEAAAVGDVRREAGLDLAIGPAPAGDDRARVKQLADGGLELRLGDPAAPWATAALRSFPCREEGSPSGDGRCFDAALAGPGGGERRVTFLSDGVYFPVCAEAT